MRAYSLALAAILSGTLTEAAKLSVSQRKRPNNTHQRRSGSASFKRPATVLAATSSSDDSDVDLSSFHDLLYIANVTVGGTEYPLQLDTGSSDLWVKGASSPLPNTDQTSLTLNLTYGIGSTFGHISYTPVEFAGINISQQAIIDASNASNPILNYGVSGIVGLGFTKLSSIDAALTKSGKSDGKSLLYNLFADNPKEPNFIAFALQRTLEATGDVEGSFTIGEYDDDYKDVANSPKIPTYPVTDPMRWTVLLDAFLIGQGSVALTSTVPNAPSDKAVVMLDSGTSYTYAPKAVCDAMYGNITGASYSSALGQWIVPCSAEVDVALQFGSSVYPIHPIDVTPVSLSDDSLCVGSFVPQTVSVGAGQFDWLIGDNVMRSLYTVYDFGDFDSTGTTMGDPYMQLLALVDPNAASTEFHKARGGSASGNITYNAQNVSSSTSATAAAASGGTSVELSDELSSTLNKLQGYLPALLAVMALNALVLLVLAGAGVAYMCRRRGKARARRNPGRQSGAASPMPLQRTSSFGMPSGSGDTHVYQPVSMALTEDTFVPPSPAFSKGGLREPSGLRMDDRPKSVA
ncbi:acid protease [Trametes versicolor FP-101664 SS1]|uniref:acid protease n=1 Tax=Trametes versicolor (strain FP-101664) TaxID=717944 RepID=UPI00046229A3|nr:acid protease [Trametes versicolor FP-101664 SS1]EIW61303.1 acid protease [Trametes versicolor FP-101664 SS1]